MNRYESRTPRAAFAVAAIALSALTMSVLVAAPATMENSTTMLATGSPNIAASRIEVIASRHDLLTLADASTPHVDR